MTPEQRRRAGKAVDDRIGEMASNPTAVARAAHVDPKTVRSLISGEHWPSDAVQERLERVLRWRPGGLHARSVRGGTDGALDALTDSELAAELLRRIQDAERRQARLRAENGRPGGN